ncbi:MAG: hypothetical protein BRC25_03205, partial [Parcubacteria group bacterium SW_6_46_9]
FTHVVEAKFIDITPHVLDFVDKVEDRFVVSIKITSDLSGRLRSHLLEGVEHLFEFEAMLAEDCVREVIRVGLTLLAPILLGVFAGRTSFDNDVTLAVDTRLRLARFGEPETSKHRSRGGRKA